MTAPSKFREGVKVPASFAAFSTLLLGLLSSGLDPADLLLLLLGLRLKLLGDLGLHLVGKGVHIRGGAVEAESEMVG